MDGRGFSAPAEVVEAAAAEETVEVGTAASEVVVDTVEVRVALTDDVEVVRTEAVLEA